MLCTHSYSYPAWFSVLPCLQFVVFAACGALAVAITAVRKGLAKEKKQDCGPNKANAKEEVQNEKLGTKLDLLLADMKLLKQKQATMLGLARGTGGAQTGDAQQGTGVTDDPVTFADADGVLQAAVR